MASVNVLNAAVVNPSAPFTANMQFEITFECVAPLSDGRLHRIVIGYVFAHANMITNLVYFLSLV